MPTFIQARVSAGAETVTDQLAGTAVALAGPSGLVRACFRSTVGTTRALLKGRLSGNEIIPNNSFPSDISVGQGVGPIDGTQFIFEGKVTPNEPLELTIVAAAACTTFVGVRTD